MKSHEIRTSFLDFFRERGHLPVASAPLVPHGDATLLFTNAGMVQFKNYFLGIERPPAPRAVTVQKCLRVSGKHNDLENVGPSPRHHTFFEMLGNFSFGDYFKDEAIRFGWELVTKVWGLPPAHLFASVFHEDDEAFELWRSLSTLPEGRIRRCGEKDNFWAMGDTGPCGPCSEIFVDLHPELPEVGWDEGTDSGRYLEIWNLVFMQYERDAAGTLNPLPRPSVDTGAGLERVTAVLQGVDSNYGTDLFRPILDGAAVLAGTRYGADPEGDVALRVIADHLRAVAFLLADGVIPGNEGRGYVLRRLLRRAVRHGMRLGFAEPFLHRLLPVVGEVLGAAYSELGATQGASAATIEAEEGKFLDTLASGARQVQVEIEAARRAGGSVLEGAAVFRLYDTYGLPLEVIREIAEEERFRLDDAGFERALEGQRERSREAAGGKGLDLKAIWREFDQAGDPRATGHTVFAGYDRLDLEAVLAWAGKVEDGRPVAGGPLRLGDLGVAIFDRTVFYAEAGGQVGDRGRFAWGGGAAEVLDTQKDGREHYHLFRVTEGELSAGRGPLPVRLQVDAALRLPTQRNHTATHLLHAALREVLGTGVRQAGSLVAPDRLRFDFTHPRPLTADELARIEARVDGQVLRAVPTAIVERDRADALALGAMALFGEKYGDRVRTVEVPGFSLELCGGCHVANTGEIGPFVVTAERGIASGVRRIEALTGEAALAQLRRRGELLAAVAERLGVDGERAAAEVDALRRQLKERDDELARLRLELIAGAGAATGASGETEVDGLRVVAREVPAAPANELRNIADTLRGKLGTGVVVLASRQDGKVTLIAAVTADLASRVPAGGLVRRLAPIVGGGGGGRPDFAQAGGKDPDRLPELLAAVPEAVRAELAGRGT